MDVCSVCESEFSLDNEGGVCGHLGMLFFSLCVTCHAGLAHYYYDYFELGDLEDCDECEDD